MPRYIDFVPKRPQKAIQAHPVHVKAISRTNSPSTTSVSAASSSPKTLSVESNVVKVKTIKKTVSPKSPAPRPASTMSRPVPAMHHGRLSMDFVRPTKSRRTPNPIAKQSTISTARRPIAKQSTTSSARRPIVKQSTTSSARRPIAKQPTISSTRRPAERPTPAPIEPEFIEDFDELEPLEPVMSDDDLSLALAGFADDEPTPVLTDNLSKEASDFEEELNALDELETISDDIDSEFSDELEVEAEEFVKEPEPLFSKKSTNKSLYSLDHSPFLSKVSVAKRPLSGTGPAIATTINNAESSDPFVAKSPKSPKSSKSPFKTTYRPKTKQASKNDSDRQRIDREAMVVSTPEVKSHNISMGIAVILTVILGAVIGAVVYLAFFQ